MALFNVSEEGLNWLRARIAKLSDRSVKLGGKPFKPTVIGYHFEGEDRKKKKVFEVSIPEREVKLQGWEFVATIDHTHELGNIIRQISNREVPEKYRTSEPLCDHCNTNRYRRDTYLVYNEDEGRFAQVGRSCLKDFIGHISVNQAVNLANLYAQIGGFIDIASQMEPGEAGYRFFDLEEYCKHVATDVLERGFVSKARASEEGLDPSASIALNYFFNRAKVSNEAEELAKKALEWARNLPDDDNMSNYYFSCKVLANSGMIDMRSTGLAASIVGVFFNNENNRVSNEQKAERSNYVGKVKEKLTFVATLSVVASNPTTFSVRHEFIDENGNVLVWFSSNKSYRNLLQNKVKVTATVKAHSEFRNVKQTILTRAKVESTDGGV